MLCRACGMESRTPNVCEWCKKPLQGTGGREPGAERPVAQPLSGPYVPPGNAPSLNPPILNPTSMHAGQPNAAPTLLNIPPMSPATPLQGQAAPLGSTGAPAPGIQPTARIQRMTLTGEVIEVPSAAEPTLQGGPGMLPGSAANATTVMTPGGAYAAMHSAGASYQTMAPQMLRDRAGMPEISPGEKWEKFLAIAAPILLLSAWLVHSMPQFVSWIGFIDLFVLSLAMGATGAVPSYDDSYFDVTVMLVVTFMFGPVIALVVYLVTAAIKQECNTAVVGLLVLQILVFQGMILAFASNTGAVKQVGALMLFGVMQFFAVFIGFLGWLLSSFFRPVGE